MTSMLRFAPRSIVAWPSALMRHRRLCSLDGEPAYAEEIATQTRTLGRATKSWRSSRIASKNETGSQSWHSPIPAYVALVRALFWLA
ncbi:hypothetical protein [Paraburkholderia sp. BL6669N2]|uniref:hypothetical protein n=1 Tax=Paraburkholderia sp. BL6669N2 TaxID=1938807 RepID=UPI000E26516C|nr:hypothetical protein [Paraburkholderia sp. BL6669N2]